MLITIRLKCFKVLTSYDYMDCDVPPWRTYISIGGGHTFYVVEKVVDGVKGDYRFSCWGNKS